MEYVVFISHVKELEYINNTTENDKQYRGNKYRKKIEEVNKKVKETFGEVNFTRLYFGNEFCEFLLPNKSSMVKVIDYVKENKLDFTLVTPAITNYGVERVKELIDEIQQLGLKTFEVVCNDWGLVYLINKEYPMIQPIVGRVLDRIPRDPRLTKEDYELCFTKSGQKVISQSSVTAKSYQEVMHKIGVERIELDMVPQGYQMDDMDINLDISLYIPFGLVTTGRLCMMRSLAHDNHFILEDKKCNCYCQKYDQIMKKSVKNYKDEMDNREKVLELYRKGNTVFFENQNLEDVLQLKFYNRLVFQPGIPM